jgi:hypothetical protein
MRGVQKRSRVSGVARGSRVVIKSVRPRPVLYCLEQADYTRDMFTPGGWWGSGRGISGGWCR